MSEQEPDTLPVNFAPEDYVPHIPDATLASEYQGRWHELRHLLLEAKYSKRLGPNFVFLTLGALGGAVIGLGSEAMNSQGDLESAVVSAVTHGGASLMGIAVIRILDSGVREEVFKRVELFKNDLWKQLPSEVRESAHASSDRAAARICNRTKKFLKN